MGKIFIRQQENHFFKPMPVIQYMTGNERMPGSEKKSPQFPVDVYKMTAKDQMPDNKQKTGK